MTPQSLYDLASAAFHDGTWLAYPVDSVPFADDMPEGIGIRFLESHYGLTRAAILPCHHLPLETIYVPECSVPFVRNFYLLDLMAHLVGP